MLIRLVNVLATISVVVFLTVVGVLVLRKILKDEEEPYISKDLIPFVKEWRADMKQERIPYREAYIRIDEISVVSDYGHKAGGSNTLFGTVKISLYQLKEGPWSTRGTLYHELGHSVFGLRHGSCHIMRDVVWTEEEYRDNWKHWVREYLDECKKTGENI
jgi:hypothetical protein